MKETKTAYQKRMKWFAEARFGMFIHWGLYTLLGRGTWVMHHDQLPRAYIEKLADKFNPRNFDADVWAQLAVEAGAKYAVLTTRHHEGFCLFDSQVSDFTSVKTAAKRDFVAEYVKAFRRAGLKVGFYYSSLDWRNRGYFEPMKYIDDYQAMVRQAHEQVRELLTNYGKIDLLWFDGQWLSETPDRSHWDVEKLTAFWQTDAMLRMIRKRQPHIIINDRSGALGDYYTPEQSLPHGKPDRPWELCETIGDYWQSWCYQRYTPRPIRKSVGQLILELVTVAKNEGNLLLNIGPKPDGAMPAEDAKRLRGVGEWLKTYGEAVYGCESAPLYPTSVGEWTFKHNAGYLHLPCWVNKELIVCRIDGKPKSATLLGAGQRLDMDFNPKTGRLILRGLPTKPPHPDVSVVKIVFDGRPRMKKRADKAAWLDDTL